MIILVDEGQMGDDISVVDYSQRFRDVFLDIVCQFDISNPWGSVGVQFRNRSLLCLEFNGSYSGKGASQTGSSHDNFLSQVGISQYFVCNFNAGCN